MTTTSLTRRTLSAALVAGTAMFGAASLAPVALAQEATVPVEDLHKSGKLPDKVMGSADAPVTIVEYASMTCGHCGAFHNRVFPELKKKYVDTGKVRFIFREFPLGSYAAAASMLARCAADDKFFPMLKVLFETQDQWAYVQANQRVPTLLGVAQQAGFTRDEFKQCLSNQELLNGINEIRDQAANVYGVTSTPTFFVNGQLMRGAGSVADFEERMKDILEKSS